MPLHHFQAGRLAAIPLALALCFSVATNSLSATYYVSTSGDDGAAGSQAAPWRTLQKAANTVAAGDIVLAESGTYAGFNLTRDGTSSAPVTFRANGNVVINTVNASTPDNINIEGADYVVVEGFIVQDGARAGIRVATSRGVVVRNNYIQNCARWGIFTAYTPDIQLIGNVCRNSTEEHGIYVSNSNVANDAPVIRGNECFGNGHNGIQLNGDCQSSGDGVISAALIENNVIHDNGWKGFSLISVQNSIIRNNILYNNGLSAGAGGIHLTDEPGCNLPSNNNVVVNNTVVEPNIAGVRIGQGSTTNVLFNNVVVAGSVSDTIVDEVGGNQIDTASNLRVASTSGLFRDAAAHDYRLAAASAAIDKGVASYAGKSAPNVDIDGVSRPSGNATDSGAYEAGTSSPPPGPTGIIASHPRILIAGGRLSELRRAACYDDAGNPLSACTPTSGWNELKNLVDNRSDRAAPMDFALAYLATGNAAYRASAIADADAMVAAGWQPVRDVNYRFLYVRDYLRNIACVYDWLYDDLSASRRTAYRNYMLMLIYVSWNDNSVSDAIYNPGGWGVSAPGNNFYYNFMLATAYGALALYGEDTSTFTWAGTTYPFSIPYNGTNYVDMLQFFYDKYTGEAIPGWLNTYGKGGGWHEGDQYGPSAKRHLFEALLAIKSAGGQDFFNGALSDFPAESVRYKLYATQPGGRVLYNGGDAGREPTMGVYDYDRHEMLCLADGLEGRPEAGYAQYYVNHYYPEVTVTQMIGLDFLFYRPAIAEQSPSVLPLSYFAEGYDWMNSRSSWGSDAVSVTFVSADKVAGHQHSDQNAFQIYRGTSNGTIDGWLVTDVQPFATSLRRSTDYHNTIIVDDEHCQRYGAGTGNMDKFGADYTVSPSYVYGLGDAADAYYTDQAVPCNSSDGTKQLNIYQRELVHVLPGYVVVFDRVTPVNASSSIKCLFHYSGQPVVTGDLLEASRGDGKVFHKVLLPAGARVTTVNEQIGDPDRIETWRSEITPFAPVPNHQFLNVFYVASRQTAQMPDAETIYSEGQTMVGPRIADPAHDIILLFSTDPSGATPPGTIEYRVGLGADSEHMLFDLAPLTEYAVNVSVEKGMNVVRVAPGRGHRTSDQGVLRFDVAGATVVAHAR